MSFNIRRFLWGISVLFLVLGGCATVKSTAPAACTQFAGRTATVVYAIEDSAMVRQWVLDLTKAVTEKMIAEALAESGIRRVAEEDSNLRIRLMLKLGFFHSSVETELMADGLASRESASWTAWPIPFSISPLYTVSGRGFALNTEGAIKSAIRSAISGVLCRPS